ncbi:hypothetical protein HA402_008601 [Bradysia odoriphaga]|nr:hypothetical protein HA402_008601 [Bradysia odoriphaga]
MLPTITWKDEIISDVKAALIYNQNLKFAPRNIQKFFKHLEAFSLFNNSIEEVTRECLDGLEQLRYFNFLYNNVENYRKRFVHYQPNDRVDRLWFQSNKTRRPQYIR